MKKILLVATLFVSCININNLLAQTPVYVTITSHNEDSDYSIPFGSYNTSSNNSKTLYVSIKGRIKQVADSIKKYNAAWNYQSDWRFLRGVIMWDTNSIRSNTNNLNILQWMTNSTYNGNRIELDCHSHEGSGYNYADVAYLYSLCSVTSSPVVGGFDHTGLRWQRFRDQDTSNLNSNFKFTFQYLSHASPGHPNDDITYGMWKPSNNSASGNTTGFYTHNTSNNLIYLGNGCNDLHIGDTLTSTAASTYVQSLITLINSIAQGKVPSNRMYVCHIQLDQKYFISSKYMTKIGQVLALLKPYVDNGKIIYATHSQKVNIYNATYSGGNFQTNCNSVTTELASENIVDQENKNLSPNPNEGIFSLSIPATITNDQIQIFDSYGKRMNFQSKTLGSTTSIELVDPSTGIYTLSLPTNSFRFVVVK